MVEHKKWKNWLIELSKTKNLSLEDANLYSLEFDIPEHLIKYSFEMEIKHRKLSENNSHLYLELNLKTDRLKKLRVKAGEYVSNATKLYKKGKEVTKEESERADRAEIELSNVRKQLELAMNIIRNKEGGISEAEIFLSTLDANTRRALERAVQKSLHPDKHTGVSKDTNRALNEFFVIINKYFSK